MKPVKPTTSLFGDAPPVWPVREDPGEAPMLIARGLMSLDAGRCDEAVRYFADAIKRSPGEDLAYCHLGRALLGTGAWELAARAFTCALNGVPGQVFALPDHVPALLGLGQALGAGGRPGEALAAFERALVHAPDLAMAHFCRGNALRDLGHADAALQAIERSIALDAGHMPAHLMRGMLLGERQCHTEALACFERALALHPQVADAHFGIGRVHESLGDHANAGRAYTEALRIAPTHVPSLTGLSNALLAAKRFDLALTQIMQVEALAPGRPYVLGMGAFLARQLCRWDAPPGDAATLAGLAARMRAGEAACAPFATLALYDDPALHRQAAAGWLAGQHPAVAAPLPMPGGQLQGGERLRVTDGRLRVAYVSSDFHEHATAYLMAGLFEAHDRARVEVIALAYGPPKDDAMRRRIAAACDRFVDISQHSDAQAAQLCRELGAHVAVDLKGLTQDARPGIFAHRAAPVQVNWLGYPGTLPAPYYDYLLADRVVVPQAERPHYAEAIAYLPGSYQVNDDRRPIAPAVPRRGKHGLPDAEGALVLCCFNNLYKLTPEVWGVWMRVLAQRPQAVLWLLAGHEQAQANLCAQVQAHGIAPQRLVFAPTVPQAQHLARLRLADLSLETLPYNAHTTASDALWAGVPHLSCMGRSFQARVGASLLMAVGMPELIAASFEDYERRLLELTADGERLAALRQTLAGRRESAALFDTARFARNIEAAFARMRERCEAGLAAEDFGVDEDGTPMRRADSILG